MAWNKKSHGNNLTKEKEHENGYEIFAFEVPEV